MKNSILLVAAYLIACSYSPVNAADSGLYIGVGVNNLKLDGAHSENYSLTGGYSFHQWDLQSSSFQTISLAIEAQYSDSMSSTDKVNNNSIFVVARAYTSENMYYKLKQGFTDYPDVALINPDAESSHLGMGVGIGYQLTLGSFEVEYIYPNKTLVLSIVEISYKYNF